MVNVAIAGGTSPTLGRSIVSAILATGKHNVIILSRAKKEKDSETSQSTLATSTTTTSSTITTSNGNGNDRPKTLSEVPILPVDYHSPTQLTQIFQQHQITHLISVLKTIDPTISLQIHRSLLSAAEFAKLTRFIMSDWSMSHVTHSRVDLLTHKSELHRLGQDAMDTARRDGKHVVECCTIQNGGFLEYFVQGADTSGWTADEAWRLNAGLEDPMMKRYIDISERRIVVPCLSAAAGNGGQRGDIVPARVSMTSLHDVGKYIAASLDLPPGQMSGYIGIAGHVFRFTDVIKLLGCLDPPVAIQPQFITKEECDDVAKSACDRLDEILREGGDLDVGLLIERMVAQMYACLCGGEEGGGVVSGRLLNELCPEVERVDLEELLRRAWGSNQ